MANIGLCMIVKNEAHVIRRCLSSVLPLIDYALIVDTGSTDGTQTIIQDFLREFQLDGVVLEEPWRDFAYNRSFALQKLRERTEIDYGLIIDADEILVFDNTFEAKDFKLGLTDDLYDIETRYRQIVYLRPQLFGNRLPFYYKGVLHEYLECLNIKSRSTVVGFHNQPIQDSARAQNPRKFHEDASVLESVLTKESDPFLISRYTFYLAQCYRDAGEAQLALNAYLRRAQQGFWQEEVYVSLLNAARIKVNLGYSEAEQLHAFMGAYESFPTRVEALHDAIRLCRLLGRYHHGYILAKQGLSISAPTQGLFIEKWIADYGLLDEFSLVAFWSGYYQESLGACSRLLEENKIPDHYRQRILDNARFSIEKLNRNNSIK